jgi:hypothetical protein
MARPEGIEPPTLCLEGRRSIRLSYGRVDRICMKEKELMDSPDSAASLETCESYSGLIFGRSVLRFHLADYTTKANKGARDILCRIAGRGTAELGLCGPLRDEGGELREPLDFFGCQVHLAVEARRA